MSDRGFGVQAFNKVTGLWFQRLSQNNPNLIIIDWDIQPLLSLKCKVCTQVLAISKNSLDYKAENLIDIALGFSEEHRHNSHDAEEYVRMAAR